jgi:hypothetical protein
VDFSSQHVQQMQDIIIERGMVLGRLLFPTKNDVKQPVHPDGAKSSLVNYQFRIVAGRRTLVSSPV